MSNRAWVTLATNDSYGLGALVLAHSLRRVNSTYPAVVLVTPSLTDAMRDRLAAVFSEVITVDVLDSRDEAHLALLARPELGITFTKIHCWSLTQYEKCVFLDADTLVVQNSDELFEREELSAAPDVGWPDCFNSGVFVFKPSKETFDALIKFAQERGSFDGGDQGLLNSFFSDWARGDINRHLPFLYNVTSAAFYSYLPAFKHFGQDLKIIHFIGVAKPWLQNFNWDTQTVECPSHLQGTLQLWWEIFVSSVHTQLDANMVEEYPTEVQLPEEPAYYTPEINPDSEFPWHHVNQEEIKEEDDAQKIDLSQFHDPWFHCKGDIPLHEGQEQVISITDRVEITPELRDYIWEYKKTQDENAHAQVDTFNQTHHSHDSAHWESLSHHDHLQHDMRQSGYLRHQQTHHHHQIDHHHNGNSWSWKVDFQVISHSQHNSLHDHTAHTVHSHEPKKSEHILQSKNHVDDKLEKKRVRRPRTQKRRIAIGMNGDLSGSDSDQSEVVIPRHPYDGFYLRHRSTFDARGRKLCTHEVPLTPTPSPPPSPLPETTEEPDDQTGVAGVLARVASPGASSSDRGAAIDELTRRQGWEQGNIDYMGADSFDNIWAKISQTLNQAPPKEASPPKDTKQPSPPKEQAPVAVQSAPVDQPAVVAAEQGTPAPSESVLEPAPIVSEKQPSPPKDIVEPSVIPAPIVPESVEDTSKAEESKNAAAVPPTPPVTPKSTSEPSTPVTESLPLDVSTEAPAATVAPVAPALEASHESAVIPVETTAAPVETQVVPVEAVAAPVEAPKQTSAVPEQVPVPVVETSAAEPTPVVAPQSPAETPAEPVAAAASLLAAAEALVSSAVEAVDSSVPSSVSTPEKSLELTGMATDSPPLAHTPGKEDPSVTSAKSRGERARKPAGKLSLSPPAAADTLPTPDSELEDAASLAQSIIAGELAAPALPPPTPATPAAPASPPAQPEPARLAAAAPAPLETPPAGPVSLAQIGVKAKPSTAEQIESSLTESASAPVPAAAADPPKKKGVKKVVKKDAAAAAAAAAGGEAPVPPPRKKEKKPKDK